MQKGSESFALPILALIVITVLTTFSPAVAEPLQVPFHDTTKAPLVINNDGKLSGIYPDIFRAVMKQAGIEVKLTPTPKLRVRRYFETGQAVLSCCDNPAWRQRPLEHSVQLFSRPFYITRDIFVFRPHNARPIEDLKDLANLTVAVIRGYGYQGEEWFGERTDFIDETAVMQAVAFGRTDVGIVNQDVALHWMGQNPGKIETGNLHDSASLHIRIHRSRADLLKPINKAILDIIEDGTRDRIIERYIKNHRDRINKKRENLSFRAFL